MTTRRYDPVEICEADKVVLDEIIVNYWSRPDTMSFDMFFFDMYVLNEFTKQELIYMELNGDIPFQALYFSQSDEDFDKARLSIKML